MSIRFKLGAQLGGLRDSAPFPCPFGSGATFFIRRAGARIVRDRAKARLQADPVQQVVLAVLATDDSVAAMQKEEDEKREAQKLLTVGSTGESEAATKPGDKAELSKDEEEAVARIFRAAGRQAMQAGLISPQELTANMFSGEAAAVESVVDLLSGWENLPGEEGMVPFSEDAARELLILDAEVPEGHEFAGKTVGEAYRFYFRKCSEKREAFRGEIIEAAAKN